MNTISVLAVYLLAVSITGHGIIERAPSSDQLSSVSAWRPVAREPIVVAKLAAPLEAGKAKVGDRVAAKVIGDYIKAGEIVIPRGSVLSGHVTQAQKRNKSNRESRLAFSFDQIQLKGGKLLPFEGQIVAVEQYFTSYESYEALVHAPCTYDSAGNCLELGDPVFPDFYHLKTTTQQPDGPQGILLISMKHNIKLGWNIQLGLRVP